MQSQNKLFDDFVKVMNGAAGTLAGMTREAQTAMQERARDWIGGLDMVSREEFEAAKLIAIAAREESAALRARVEALEAALAVAGPNDRAGSVSSGEDTNGAGDGAAAAARQAAASRPKRKPDAS